MHFLPSPKTTIRYWHLMACHVESYMSDKANVHNSFSCKWPKGSSRSTSKSFVGNSSPQVEVLALMQLTQLWLAPGR